MFDVGFLELLIIAVVALLVLGPERLPKAARFAGYWIRRARAQWYGMKAEFERELAADDMRKGMQDLQDSMQDMGRDLQQAGQELKQEIDGLRAQGERMVDPARHDDAADPAPDPVADPGANPSPDSPSNDAGPRP